jgi:hypothetical protein
MAIIQTDTFSVDIPDRVETLDWTHYGFTSFDERFSAPGEVPRRLQLHKSDLARGDFSNVHCRLESS